MIGGWTDGCHFECGQGFERGDLADPTRPLPPGRVDLVLECAPLRRRLRGLWCALRDALPDSVGEVGVEIDHAEIEESGDGPTAIREIVVARALLGTRRGGFAPWSRAVPLETDAWPEGWLPAVAREARSWFLPRGPEPRGPVWLDVFAAADLLRLASLRWLREGRPGDRVAAAGVEVVAPDSPLPAVVERGVLVGLPRGAEQMVRESWRQPPRPGWSRLCLSLREVAPAPTEGWWVSRLHTVGAFVVGAGFEVDAGGRAVSRWGPVPLEGVERWLEFVTASDGPPVEDGAGMPVKVPCLRVDPGGA